MVLFLEKKDENSYLLYIIVKPNAKKQTIVINEDNLIISLCSKPIQNKANKELISLLKKKFKLQSHQIELISGIKDKNKTIRCNFPYDIDNEGVLQKLLMT